MQFLDKIKNDYHYNEVVGGYEVNLEEFAKSKFIMKYINKRWI